MTTSTTTTTKTSLIELVKKSDMVAVKNLLDCGLDTININEIDCDGSNVTALYYACEIGNVEMVKLLLSISSIDPNAAGEYGDTPLVVACEKKSNLNIIKLLLAHPNIDVNKRVIYGGVYTPLYTACDQGNLAIVRLLMSQPGIDVNMNCGEDDGDVDVALHAACSQGFSKIVTALLAHPSIDVNVQDTYGRTPFYMACNDNHTKVVELLLARDDVDVNLANKYGKTPYQIVKDNHDYSLTCILPGAKSKWEKLCRQTLALLTGNQRINTC